MPIRGVEIANEMGLVEVTEFQRQLRPVHHRPGLDARDRLVQAIAVDDPFRSHAHVLLEQALQAALAGFAFRDELFDRGDRGVRGDTRDAGGRLRHFRIR